MLPPHRHGQDLDADPSLLPQEARCDAIGFLLDYGGYGKYAVPDPVPASAPVVRAVRGQDLGFAGVGHPLEPGISQVVIRRALIVPERECVNDLAVAAGSERHTRIVKLPEQVMNYGQGLAQLRRQ